MMEPYRLKLITGPVIEPVTIATLTANDYLKDIDLTNAKQIDLFNNTLIPAAREIAEHYLNRALLTQTWEMSFDCQPALIEFPKGELQSVTSVKTLSETAVETTESASLYQVVTGDQGMLFLKSGSTWTTTTRAYDLFRIRFVCGWTAAASVPTSIKAAITMTIAQLYAKREAAEPLDIAKLFFDVKRIYSA